MSESNRILMASEVAEILSVNKETVYRLARKGIIPSFHIGCAVRFSEQLIMEWIQKESVQQKKK